jgi:hemolysin-activating ACP:hemolysin acyltransferase
MVVIPAIQNRQSTILRQLNTKTIYLYISYAYKNSAHAKQVIKTAFQ